jgi:hypothetical protein
MLRSPCSPLAALVVYSLCYRAVITVGNMSGNNSTQSLPPEILNHNEGPSLIIVSAVSIPFALGVVAIRVWARHRKRMALERDDFMILLSLVS